MKFIAALLVTTLICVVLGVGLGLAAHGYGVWFFLLGLAAFLAMFIRYGCMGH